MVEVRSAPEVLCQLRRVEGLRRASEWPGEVRKGAEDDRSKSGGVRGITYATYEGRNEIKRKKREKERRGAEAYRVVLEAVSGSP